MNAHTNAHIHTTTHTCTCNTQICMCIYAHNTTHTCTHNTMCTQDEDCPLNDASREGHDRIVEMLLHAGAIVDLQNKVFHCFSVTSVVPYALFIVQKVPHNIQGNMNVRKHILQITAADMHWRITSSVHWKHVNLVHKLGTFFIFYFFYQKIWTENASLGSKLQ